MRTRSDATVDPMSGEAAERYYSNRARLLADRRARQEEWDFLAVRLDKTELADGVGIGWRELVLKLHHDLLVQDPGYRLYGIEEQLGGLVVIARFASAAQEPAARLLQTARAAALATCEVCGEAGVLRSERVQMKTLCDDCWTSDRTAAESGGERYADAVLARLLSADQNHPSPEEILAWLEDLDDGF